MADEIKNADGDVVKFTVTPKVGPRITVDDYAARHPEDVASARG